MSRVSETYSTGADAALAALVAQLGSAVVLPGDEGWDVARSAWNLAVDQRPAAVVTPRSIDDVTRVVAAAAAGGLAVTVQPNGHGANGSMDGCILVRTAAFDEITVDTDARTVRIGAGVKWGSVLPALEGTGLIALAGTNPDVTAAGYLLSGGHSWFSRWKGLAAHSITAVDLVDAEGNVRRVTLETDPDLLWALRGGTGHFGVVTALEIALYPAPALFGGKLMFPGALAEAVVTQVAAIMAEAPNELSVFAGMMNLPDIDMVPPPLRGQTIATADVVFVGDADTGRSLLVPLLTAVSPIADLTREFTISQLGSVADEPTMPSAAEDWSAAVAHLDGDGIASLVEAFREATPVGLTLLQLRPLGGAQADAQAGEAGVAGSLSADYILFAAALVMDPTQSVDTAALYAPLNRAVEGQRVPEGVPSMLGRGGVLADVFDTAALARLTEIKHRVDPAGLFRSNRNLPES